MVKYKDAIALGMERVELDDVGFHDEFGYDCFYLEKKLKHGTLYWYPDKRGFELINKSLTKPVKDIHEVELLIQLYT